MNCSDITKHSGPKVARGKRQREHKKEEKKRRVRWTTARVCKLIPLISVTVRFSTMSLFLQIATLVQAVNDHKEERGWEGVAEAVGNGIKPQQCSGKWHLMQARERGWKIHKKWTSDEVKMYVTIVFA